MPGRRQRPLYIAMVAMAAVWLVCWAGYVIAKRSRMTAEKVSQYQRSIDFARLSAAERAKALRELVDKLNALSLEERRHWHFDRDWFAQLTEEEKAWLIDAAMPSEMKQELAFFEQLPKEKRQKIIDEAMKNMREMSANGGAGQNTGTNGTNAPMFSPELEAKIRTEGLKSFYSESSAQTKAELAPLLNEVQRQMESGRLGHNNGF